MALKYWTYFPSRHLKVVHQQTVSSLLFLQASQWDYGAHPLLKSHCVKLRLCESSLILIAQNMPLHTSISLWRHWLPVLLIKDVVPLIARWNPPPKSSETKYDINHISRLGHVWESDVIIGTGGGSGRQSSRGRRVASFDSTARMFPPAHDRLDPVWHKLLRAWLPLQLRKSGLTTGSGTVVSAKVVEGGHVGTSDQDASVNSYILSWINSNCFCRGKNIDKLNIQVAQTSTVKI